MRLHYAIKLVDDMDSAVAFNRDKPGLTLGFASPFWSEFETGETKLALHPSSHENPAGTVQLGFAVGDVDRFFDQKHQTWPDLHQRAEGRPRDTDRAFPRLRRRGSFRQQFGIVLRSGH